ncbi:sensor histidine kinase [Pokkaliibacter sp. CJK22405]|uniref:sensor histidine kinase n=1 Tax=Pokkaliibacter sp. CJK22405 TaxID=3384615 RepID=UPI003984F66D
MKSFDPELINAMAMRTPAVVLYKDANLVITRVSESFLELFKFREAEVIGKTADEIFENNDARYHEADLRILAEGETLLLDEHFVHPLTGKDVWLSTEKFPVYDAEDVLVGICSISHDVTERRVFKQLTHSITQAVSRRYGQDFFEQMALNMRDALGASHVFISRIKPEESAGMMLALCNQQGLMTPFSHPIAGTPCAETLTTSFCVYKDEVQQRFPEDESLGRYGARGYVAATLLDQQGDYIGVMGALFNTALPSEDIATTLMGFFADRVASEMERYEAVDALKALNYELEQRVQERTSALEAVNSELEAFAYSVSHDLRAPLRALDGYSHALLEDYETQLDDTGQLYLQRLRNAAQQMGELIDALLELSRVARSSIRREQVNLSEMAQELVTDLELENPELKVTTQIEQNLVVEGDPALLRSVMQNLLTNAWKYSSKSSQPEIKVGKRIEDGVTNFYVEDNGVGFEPSQEHRLFKPFQRLHDRRDFDGIGIGLATVARIIRRHGGQIRGRGFPDKGCCFSFTLCKESI